MERRYYTAESLEQVLRSFEDRYGLSSSDFYELHLADQLPLEVPGFHRHTWASFYRDVQRLSGADFARHAEGVLAAS
jgi:hypothetical protein